MAVGGGPLAPAGRVSVPRPDHVLGRTRADGFGEEARANVAIVFVKNNGRARGEPHPVAYWRREDATVTTLGELSSPDGARTDLAQRVLRLRLHLIAEELLRPRLRVQPERAGRRDFH
jgi:hypothetical protein